MKRSIVIILLVATGGVMAHAGTTSKSYHYKVNRLPAGKSTRLFDGNSQAIYDANGQRVFLANYQSADFGNYTLEVTITSGSVTSSVARLVANLDALAVEPLIAAGRVELTVVGAADRMFTLQGLPDLFHWAFLGNYTNQIGTIVLTNTPPAGQNAYFYRTIFNDDANPPPVPAPILSDVQRLSDSRMNFRLNSTAASVWRIEGSPDLLHWGSYGLVTNQTGVLSVTNTPVGWPAAYFYRAIQQ